MPVQSSKDPIVGQQDPQAPGSAPPVTVAVPAPVALAPPPQPLVATSGLTLEILAEKSIIGVTDAIDLFADVHIQAPLQATAEKRPPISLCAVVDRSGSMAGAKLDLVKQTMNHVIEELSEQDFLGVVSFGSDITEVLPMTPMNFGGKGKAKSAVESMRDRGCTNLSGGLFKGLEIMSRQVASRSPSRLGESDPTSYCCWLLTDGDANEGIQEIGALCEELRRHRSEFRKAPLVSTFGYGSDHKPEFLRKLAESGTGIYNYVKSVTDIPSAFATALGGLMSVTASNVKIQISIEGGAVIKSVETVYAHTDVPGGRGTEVVIGELYSEEHRDIVLTLAIPSVPGPLTMPLVKALVNYRDPVLNVPLTVEQLFSISRCAGPTPPDQPVALRLDEQKNRLLLAKALKDAEEAAARSDHVAAQAAVRFAKEKVKASPSAFSPYGIFAQQELDLAEQNVASSSIWNARGKHMVAQCAMEHVQQRAAGDWEDVGRFSAFSNSAQKSMKSKFKK